MCRRTERPWKQTEQLRKWTLSVISCSLLSIRYGIRLCTKKKTTGDLRVLSLVCYYKGKANLIHHYHSTFKIQLNGNNYKYKIWWWIKFYASDKSQLSTIIILHTEKHELMQHSQMNITFYFFELLLWSIISSYCLLYGNWGWQMSWVSKNEILCF